MQLENTHVCMAVTQNEEGVTEGSIFSTGCSLNIVFLARDHALGMLHLTYKNHALTILGRHKYKRLLVLGGVERL